MTTPPSKRRLPFTMEPVTQAQLRLFRDRTQFLLNDPAIGQREVRDLIANAYAQGVWDTAEFVALRDIRRETA